MSGGPCDRLGSYRHVGTRFFFVHEWARAAGRDVRVALVTRPERIDPRKFGITVAANLGSIAEVFTSEEDALKWLQELSE